MSRIHILTDTAATFGNPRLMQQYPLMVLPVSLEIGGNLYREGIDLNADEIMRLIGSRSTPPVIVPPTVPEYIAAYSRLLHISDAIISLHPSRELSRSYDNAREAARQVSGNRNIAVIDTRTIGAGQGMLARVAGEAILRSEDFSDIVYQVRGAIDRIYSAYYTETLHFLMHNDILSPSRATLGAYLKIKPCLSVEDGRMIVTEKVRTLSQAVDRLVEFLVEFEHLDDATILQHRMHISEQTRVLQDRLSVEFPGRHFPYSMYNATLASLIGVKAAGVVVLESEISEDDDGF